MIEFRYRRDIQVLRGIAVLAVLLFHFEKSYFPLGYLGVDVFFVISGFVITPLMLRIFITQSSWTGRTFELRSFYRRRFYRLAPALAMTLAISSFIILLFGQFTDYHRFTLQGISTIFLVGNLSAIRNQPDYFSPNPNPFIHSWSLSVEEQIYIFLPLSLMVILHNVRSVKKVVAIAFGGFAIVSLMSFIFPTLFQPIYSLAGITNGSAASFYLPTARFWQFALGGFIFLYLDRYNSNRLKVSANINLVLSFVLFLSLFACMNVDPTKASIIVSFVTVAVILFKSVENLPQILISTLIWLGDRSYSIYLVHFPLLYIAKFSPVFHFGSPQNRILQSLIALITSILFGNLLHSKIENKYRSLYKVALISPKVIVISSILTIVVPLIILFSLKNLNSIALTEAGKPIPGQTLPWDWDKECQFLSAPPNINYKPCKYGNYDSEESILLIGDSHAASVSRPIVSIGASYEWNTYIFTHIGCAFVLGNEEFRRSYSYPYLTKDCLKHNRLILEFVKAKKPTVIIYVQRSSSIMVTPNNSIARTHFNEMVRRNLKVLIDEGIDFIHVGAAPELVFPRTVIQDGLFPESKFSAIPFEDNRFWRGNRLDGYYLDTLKLFCPLKACSNRSGKGWLFVDGHHYSEIGADRLKPEIEQFVKKIALAKKGVVLTKE